MLIEALQTLNIPFWLVTERTGKYATATDVYVLKEHGEIGSKVALFIDEFLEDDNQAWDIGIMLKSEDDKDIAKKIKNN